MFIIFIILLLHTISILDFVFTTFISHALITLCCREKKLVPSDENIVCLGNSVVSMRDLDLASRVPTKTKDDDAAKMFHAKLTLSKTFSLGVWPSHAN